MIELEQFDKVVATFHPTRTDDLQPGVGGWIGRRLEWQAAWIIERGPYEGEWAMTPLDREFPAAWAPLSDLLPW